MTAAERTSSGAGDERVEAELRLTEDERDRVSGAPPWRRWAVLDGIKADAYFAGVAARPDDGAGERLAAVEVLHVSSEVTRGVGRHLAGTDWTPYCEECKQDWPCNTTRAALGQAAGGKGAQAGVSGAVSAEQAGDERGDHA